MVLCLAAVTLVFSCVTDDDTSGPGEDSVLFLSTNWGDDSLKLTDDFSDLANGDTAVPRTVSGPATTINHPTTDSLAVDRTRKLAYVADSGNGNVLVFNNLNTIIGDVAPYHTINVGDDSIYEGIAIDSSRDRLYVGGNPAVLCVYVFNDASTLDGTVTPDAVISSRTNSIFFDQTNDRLFLGVEAPYGDIYVFDQASSLTTGDTPDRTITFSQLISVTGLWADAARDRLYVGTSYGSSGGHYLFVFDNASTMDGEYDQDTDSVARISAESISCMVDHQDNLYAWRDSADRVRIYGDAGSLSGDVLAPDKTIHGVVDHGYGMDYLLY
jgi:hypothetical protein